MLLPHVISKRESPRRGIFLHRGHTPCMFPGHPIGRKSSPGGYSLSRGASTLLGRRSCRARIPCIVPYRFQFFPCSAFWFGRDLGGSPERCKKPPPFSAAFARSLARR